MRLRIMIINAIPQGPLSGVEPTKNACDALHHLGNEWE